MVQWWVCCWLIVGGLLFLTLLERLFFCTDFSCKKQLEQLVAFQTASEVRSMSIRGVRQLKEFVIRYSDYDGSSKHIRYVAQPILQGTKSFFSSITYIAIFISSSFSYETVIGFALIWFLWHKQTPSFLLKQKSSDVNLEGEDLSAYFYDLRNQVGRKVWVIMRWYIIICWIICKHMIYGVVGWWWLWINGFIYEMIDHCLINMKVGWTNAMDSIIT